MSFVSLHTALSGIRAARVGLDTTAHNVANANTDGYTRQRVELETRHPHLAPEGRIGTGATVADIARLRDGFLDARLRGDLARGGSLDVRADLLSRAETVLGEPENGLTSELSELWAAFEELALRPEDRATRRQVLSSLESLAARSRSIAGGLEILHKDTATTLGLRVEEANGLFDQAAALNVSILDASSGAGTPNDLLDRRDQVIDRLSEAIGAQAIVADDGTVRVSVAGMAVVSGARASHLSLDPASFAVSHPAGVAVRPGGEIAGLQTFLTEELPRLSDRLDEFAVGLKTTLNDQHAAGYTTAGTAGGDLLTGTSALTLEIATDDPDSLAAAEDEDGHPFDGRNATALAALRTDSTLDAELRTLVTEHAAAVQGIERAAAGQRQLTAVAETARQGMHGVSVDEEMVAMLNYQRALEASSRVMSAVDQALDVIINRTGLVGR